MSQPEQHTTLGKYALIRKIAEGGMAEIFLAEQQGPGGFQKQLVIKRILPHLADDKKFVEMFLDEARIAAQFNNPNIVQIYDLGDADGAYYIAMEFIDGFDLSQIIERAAHFGKRVPTPVAARIIADSLNGLHYAHEFRAPKTGEPLHLVHRDISPQNLLVNRDGVVKLVDFGVAKARTSSAKTQTGAVKGKFSYMAPEQIAGETLDGRCDIFAMGIVLYELLLGVRPFGEHSDLMAITAIVHQPPKNPREIDENFPADLEHIIEKALSKDRDTRYATALDMQRDLEMYLQGTGIFISVREVAAYLEDLFSENPSLNAIGMGASATHDISISALEAAGRAARASALPSSGDTSALAARSSGALESAAPSPTPKEGGSTGLLAAIIVVALLIIGGGAALAYVLLFADSGAGDAEAKSSAAQQEDVAQAPPDTTGATKVAVVTTSKPQPDVASASGDRDVATSAAPNTANDVVEAHITAPAPADVAEAQADSAQSVAQQEIFEEGDDVVEGEPDAVAVARPDVTEVSPGVPSAVGNGFGEIRIKTNLKAKAYYKGRAVGRLPMTLSLKAGEHELKLVSTDKKVPAEKKISVKVIEARKYEVEMPFEIGTLKLVTVPATGFKATIDGNAIGSTPLQPVDLYEGTHTLELTGIADKKKRRFSITIRPGVNPRRIRVK